MSGQYRIFGAEVSPYSVKVRSYFRYKQIPHEWIVRGPSSAAEYQKYAKLPIIPLVVSPEGEAMQDSTPIIETLEQRFPEPSIHPDDPIASFVSALLEEFGDEWGNKWMFHYRWAREADQVSASERIGAAMSGASGDALAQVAAGIRERMVGRVWFVGSNAQTAPQIEDGFQAAIAQIEAHLAGRPYLFGARPAFGDFGMWGQIYNAWTDPTPGAYPARARAARRRVVSAHARSEGRGAVRAVGEARADARPAARRAGRAPVPAVVARERESDHRRGGGVQRRARR